METCFNYSGRTKRTGIVKNSGNKRSGDKIEKRVANRKSISQINSREKAQLIFNFLCPKKLPVITIKQHGVPIFEK